MRHSRLWIAIAGCLVMASLASAGTTTRKPGLWEITTTITWQKAPQAPGVDGARLNAGTHTSQVCLTQEMIDDYGALLPHNNRQCKIENRVTTESKTTGDYVCTGTMEGKGTLESTWTDTEHVTGKVHFTGTYLVGGQRQEIEWTTESNSKFKGTSCGAIRPQALPGNK